MWISRSHYWDLCLANVSPNCISGTCISETIFVPDGAPYDGALYPSDILICDVLAHTIVLCLSYLQIPSPFTGTFTASTSKDQQSSEAACIQGHNHKKRVQARVPAKCNIMQVELAKTDHQGGGYAYICKYKAKIVTSCTSTKRLR